MQMTTFHLCVYSSPGFTLILTSESLYIILEFMYELQRYIGPAQLCDLEQVTHGLCAVVS